MVERVNRTVRVLPDATAAGRAVAERLIALSDAPRAPGRDFLVAISGGRTPEPMFRALAGRADGSRRWPVWQLFWCDERLVPPDDPRSNFGVVRRLWIDPAGFPPGHVHPVGTGTSAEEAARRYEGALRAFFERADAATFDAVVLGVGPDGHTASLFPGAASLDVTDRWVVAEPRPTQPPDVPRVTLTLEAIARARTAIFLVCGPDKRAALSRLLVPPDRTPGAEALPAARVTARESVEWFLDRDAEPRRRAGGRGEGEPVGPGPPAS